MPWRQIIAERELEMKHTLNNKTLSIEVDEFGAEVVSVKVNGVERQWQNPTGEWAGHAPLLFPVCGHFGVTVDGKQYPIKAHGFAKRKPFVCTDKGENFLTFALSADDETRAVYPYEFVFLVTYKIEGNTLSIEYVVENKGDKPLYFACGGHESFDFGYDVDGYEIEFEKDERFTHVCHDDGGYLTGETLDFGKGKTFYPPSSYMQGGATVIFKDIHSRKVTLKRRGGEALAEITFDGFSNLLIWREETAKYLCIEPWTNLPDYAGVADKEFSQKDGVIAVAVGEKKKLVRTVTYL